MSHSPPWYVVASARGLQDYILRSPELKDMIGASELIESLASRLGPELLRTLGVEPESGRANIVGSSAGSLRIVFDAEDPAREFARMWPFLCDQVAPGLEVVCALGQLDPGNPASIREVELGTDSQRNRRHVSLPVGNLATRWNPQTGRPARPVSAMAGKADERLDRETAAKRQASAAGSNALVDRCLPESFLDRGGRCAMDLRHFTRDDSSYVALIHIDTNGLGIRFSRMAAGLAGMAGRQDWLNEWGRRFLATSEALAQATAGAVKQALDPLLARLETPGIRNAPVRPLVCAGDDITLLIDADWALEFTRDYLEALPALFTQFGRDLPEEFTSTPLTASAGIVYVPAKFPFYDAYDACERLVKRTKERTGRSSSGVSFVRLTEPVPDTPLFPEIELLDGASPGTLEVTQCPYRIQGPGPLLSDLATLHERLTTLVSPGLRSLLRGQRLQREDLKADFARICEVLEDRWPGASHELREALARLTGTEPASPECLIARQDGSLATPLRDALELVALGVPALKASTPEPAAA